MTVILLTPVLGGARGDPTAHERIVTVLAVVAALLAGCDIAIEQTARPPAALPDLDVAAEDPEGYDRALFGDYNRDTVLAGTRERWPNGDGYYSTADDQCHTSEDAVQVDHIVARSEA